MSQNGETALFMLIIKINKHNNTIIKINNVVAWFFGI